VKARIRERGLAGDDPALAYFEWSPDIADPASVTPAQAIDPEVWAQANPALGIRVSLEHVGREQRSMEARTFAVERLSVGDWPSTEGLDAVIAKETWAACGDVDSEALDPVCFGFDITPDRSSSSIAAAGRRSDGKIHVEVVDRRRGTSWVSGRLNELRDTHGPSAILCDAKGPVASLLPELEELGVDVTTVTASEHGQACGIVYDACDQGTLRHLDQPELNAAVRGAMTRPLGDAWAWSRKNSAVDIAPLVASTLATWGVAANPSGDVAIEWWD
jgi:hypothetical protein